MATISGSNSTATYTLKEFYGLNESPDGDTKLKMGEANAIRNFKITRDKNLKTRPGNMREIGLCKSYEIAKDSLPTMVVREDGNGAIKAYPSYNATYYGFIEMTGESISVTHKNADSYKGYIFKYGYFYYELSACKEVDGEYEWFGYLVTVKDASDESHEVQGIWTGYIDGSKETIAACQGHMYKLWDAELNKQVKIDLGEINTENRCVFFAFNNICYILNGYEYYQYDGHCMKLVEGYRPVVSVSNPPAGGGTLLEQINKLTSGRRAWFTADGESTTYTLPEQNLMTIDWVKNTVTEETITDFTYDLVNGTVTFAAAPAKGIQNNIEIAYSASVSYRDQVCKMRDFEFYTGTGESRVILYGDGSNEFFYSSIDYDGNVRADYFPDDNEVEVGTKNTKLTGLCRHFSQLIAFKEDSTYAITYGTVTLSTGSTTEAFYVIPVNKIIGCSSLFQTCLVLNNPRTLFNGELYEWKSTSSKTSSLTYDERQAIRISDRVHATLSSFDFSKAYCYDANMNQEYFICYNGEALVHNYAVDAWYYYDGLDVNCMCESTENGILIGSTDGYVQRLSEDYRTNNGEMIDSYWESGSMDFGKNFQRKNSSELWVVLKPESRGAVNITVQTDKKSINNEKMVESSIFDFGDIDFEHLSFNTNRKPHTKRLKIKAKKFVFYKIIFETARPGTSATVLSASLSVRFTGKAK